MQKKHIIICLALAWLILILSSSLQAQPRLEKSPLMVPPPEAMVQDQDPFRPVYLPQDLRAKIRPAPMPVFSPRGEPKLTPKAVMPGQKKSYPSSPGRGPITFIEGLDENGSEMIPRAWNCPASRYQQWLDYDWEAFPNMVIGLVVAETPRGTIHCSGAVIHKDLVLTAGHCVSGNGIWFNSIRFYPGYQQGYSYGEWQTKWATAWDQWRIGGHWDLDLAVLVMWPSGGWRIGDALGHLGFSTGVDFTTKSWSQYGYPVNVGDGQVLCRVNSGYGHHFNGQYSSTIGVGSGMQDGSSGGPWILFEGSSIYANGINSHRVIGGTFACQETMYSPEFNNYAWDLAQFALSLD